VRFAAVPSPYQAAYDHAVLLRHEALRGMDGFELRYRSAFSSCGSSGGPPPELTVDLIVKSHVEAERIAENLKARLSSAGARPAKDGLKGRAKELTERVAGWLQARHARLISEEEAQALLRP
jgi:hypothetical protein